MDADSLTDGNIKRQVFVAGEYFLVSYFQMGEPYFGRLGCKGRQVAIYGNQPDTVRDKACCIVNGEQHSSKTGYRQDRLAVVVDKVVFCGLKARQPIVGCYPDTSFIIFQDTADTVVWQAMKGVVTDKLFFSIFVLHTFINAITVAAQHSVPS